MDARPTQPQSPVRTPPAPRGKEPSLRSQLPQAVEFHFLSQLLGTSVRYDGEALPIGRLYDIGASAKASYPEAACMSVRGRRGDTRLLPWKGVKSVSRHGIVLTRADQVAPEPDFWVRRDVLDDQVVDVSGAKVVRVNDVHLIFSNLDGKLVFGHVEVGVLGILRRLGVERAGTFLLQWLLDYTLKESFVTWRHIEVLSPGWSPGGVRVSRLPQRLSSLHPAELADMVEQLGVKDRQAVFNALSLEKAAETLEETAPEVQRTLVAQQEPGKAADILEQMTPGDAADVLRDMGPDAQAIIGRMQTEPAGEVKALLAQDEEAAGSVMTKACLEARPDEPVSVLLSRMREESGQLEVLHYAYVCDAEHRLLGVLGLREVMSARPDQMAGDRMTKNVVTVSPEQSARVAARLLLKYGWHAIPVVDQQGVFLGAVRLDRVLTSVAPQLE